MATYLGQQDFRHDSTACIGVLIINLGTPEHPTARSVRQYLAEFLWDPRVVEIPRLLWWLMLHGMVLPFRPARSAKAYQAIWTDQGSPLLTISKQQAHALEIELKQQTKAPIKLALAMRYGRPSIQQALTTLRDGGAQRLIVLPMYPQYSATTTASCFDAVSATLRTWRWIPELRFINHYPDHPGYIASCAKRIHDAWQAQGRTDYLVFSFHGLPKRCLLNGDPYFCECHKTARLIAQALSLNDDAWQITFQSRFGRQEWLKPYTEQTLKALPSQGKTAINVFCPGFAADCLETLEEIALQNRDFFLAAGGQHFSYIPALNTMPEHISALSDLVLQHMQGWPEILPTYDADKAQTDQQHSQQRAMKLGSKQ